VTSGHLVSPLASQEKRSLYFLLSNLAWFAELSALQQLGASSSPSIQKILKENP
jgi:hypothetical protein